MLQRVIEQVAGILHRNEVPFVTRADGNGYRILRDSSATFISFAEFGETVMVSVHSPVLQEIDEETPLIEILTAVNDLNANTRFSRFVYYPEERVIAVEYDLAGDDMQESELILAVQRISFAANTQDEELKLRLGTGLRFSDTLPDV
jgi:hypothetical protein